LAGNVTAGLVQSNGSLPLDLVTCGLTAKKPCPTEYGTTFMCPAQCKNYLTLRASEVLKEDIVFFVLPVCVCVCVVLVDDDENKCFSKKHIPPYGPC